MADGPVNPVESPQDVGEYCRRVEEHLTRVNEGELIRIFGQGFDLVRGWAREGIPLSVVFHGIDRKAERHARGSARRALRLEFCEADVRAAFEHWRRAVGLWTIGSGDDGQTAEPTSAHRRRPSLAKTLERAADRLVAAAGRMETPEPLRIALSSILESVVILRERAAAARGADRDALVAALPPLDRQMLDEARAAIGDLAPLRAEAEGELAPYRRRLAPDIWEGTVSAGIDRLLRERYGLPMLDADQL